MATSSFFTDFKVNDDSTAEQLLEDMNNSASEVVSSVDVDEVTYEGDKLYSLFASRSEK